MEKGEGRGDAAGNLTTGAVPKFVALRRARSAFLWFDRRYSSWLRITTAWAAGNHREGEGLSALAILSSFFEDFICEEREEGAEEGSHGEKVR